jgi:hypothetical protein
MARPWRTVTMQAMLVMLTTSGMSAFAKFAMATFSSLLRQLICVQHATDLPW